MILICGLAIPVLVRLSLRFPKFQLIQPLLQFIETQKHPPVLAQELPAKPAARGKDQPHQHEGALEHATHGLANRHIRVAVGWRRNRKRNH